MELTLTSDIICVLRETPPEAPRIQHALQEWTSLCNSLPSTALISRTAIVQEGIQLKMRAGQEWTPQVAQAYGAFLRSLTQLTEAAAHDRPLTTTAASGPQGGSHTATYASPVQFQGGQHDDIPLARVITLTSPTVGNPVAAPPVQQSATNHSQAPTLRYLATILFPQQPFRPFKAIAASLSITLIVGGAAIALNSLHPYAGFGLGIAFLILIMVIRTCAFRTWNWDDRFRHAASLLVGVAVGVMMLSLVSLSSSDNDEEDEEGEEDEDENSGGLSWVGQLAQVAFGLVLWAVFVFLYLKRGRQFGFPGPYDDLPPPAPQQPADRRAEVV